MRIRTIPGWAALAGAMLALAACGGGQDKELAALDEELSGTGEDPALTSALEDPILVDPTLQQQSNRNAVRPPETPGSAPYPPRDEEAGAVRQAGAATGAARAQLTPEQGGACVGEFRYGPEWAGRLPAPFAVYPGARVIEAAANRPDGCRVVTFSTAAAPGDVLGWYRQRAEDGGFSAAQQRRGGDIVLAGVRGGGASAYYLIVTPRGRGSEVALIAN